MSHRPPLRALSMGSSPGAGAAGPASPEYASARSSVQLSADLSNDLAFLESLRASVRANLMLRPLEGGRPLSFASESTTSPTDSMYFTPTSATFSTYSHASEEDTDREDEGEVEVEKVEEYKPLMLSAESIARRLSATLRPLLLDVRPSSEYEEYSIRGSVSMPIPPLPRQNALSAVRAHLSTGEGKAFWDEAMQSAWWDGDLVLVTQEGDMDHNISRLIQSLAPLLDRGTPDVLAGGFTSAFVHPMMKQHLVSQSESESATLYTDEPDEIPIPGAWSTRGLSINPPPPSQSSDEGADPRFPPRTPRPAPQTASGPALPPPVLGLPPRTPKSAQQRSASGSNAPTLPRQNSQTTPRSSLPSLPSLPPPLAELPPVPATAAPALGRRKPAALAPSFPSTSAASDNAQGPKDNALGLGQELTVPASLAPGPRSARTPKFRLATLPLLDTSAKAKGLPEIERSAAASAVIPHPWDGIGIGPNEKDKERDDDSELAYMRDGPLPSINAPTPLSASPPPMHIPSFNNNPNNNDTVPPTKPTLRKLDTRSAERLPKLSLRTALGPMPGRAGPLKSATLAAPPQTAGGIGGGRAWGSWSQGSAHPGVGGSDERGFAARGFGKDGDVKEKEGEGGGAGVGGQWLDRPTRPWARTSPSPSPPPLKLTHSFHRSKSPRTSNTLLPPEEHHSSSRGRGSSDDDGPPPTPSAFGFGFGSGGFGISGAVSGGTTYERPPSAASSSSGTESEGGMSSSSTTSPEEHWPSDTMPGPGPKSGWPGHASHSGWPGSSDMDEARTPTSAVHMTAGEKYGGTGSDSDGECESAEGEAPRFILSMILPGFLFLGPEPTEEAHIEEMQAAGITRILNLATECGADDWGLKLSERFQYRKIGMRDTVEEDGVTGGVREACEVLDDASLHNAPTYVHCKAGKSRSVTAVIAYLIHANAWTLSRAYQFVLERRKGISPNIGFVSELMAFEESELGGKSVGVIKDAATPSDSTSSTNSHQNQKAMAGGGGARRNAHIRESLPPAFTLAEFDVGEVEALGAGAETEVRDKEGRYRFARRAPVDANTLQPSRRVSKAGLESGGWEVE
ncbi:hypothetical protein PENSPDRAFT_757391 [Peniophora sp. CONT]|nr:hypothetical protein PENSPDRAFT_757391 [Peniophora sp. CONT]